MRYEILYKALKEDLHDKVAFELTVEWKGGGSNVNIQRKVFMPRHSKSQCPGEGMWLRCLRKNKETIRVKTEWTGNNGRRYCVGVVWGNLVGPLQDVVTIWDFILSEMGIYWRVWAVDLMWFGCNPKRATLSSVWRAC